MEKGSKCNIIPHIGLTQCFKWQMDKTPSYIAISQLKTHIGSFWAA